MAPPANPTNDKNVPNVASPSSNGRRMYERARPVDDITRILYNNPEKMADYIPHTPNPRGVAAAALKVGLDRGARLNANNLTNLYDLDPGQQDQIRQAAMMAKIAYEGYPGAGNCNGIYSIDRYQQAIDGASGIIGIIALTLTTRCPEP